MNNNINALLEKLSTLQTRQHKELSALTEELQSEYNLVFEKDHYIQGCINVLEGGGDFTLEGDGLYLWVRFELADYRDCLEYLEDYLNDAFGYRLDRENDCLMNYCGDDYIAIQDDCARADNRGVWQYHDRIIKETEYLNDNGEVNEALRNKLIEEHMEREGVYPNVGRVTQYGDFYPINTNQGAE